VVRRQGAEDGVDVCEDSVGSVNGVCGDVFPNLVEICERIGVESVGADPPERRRSLFSRNFLKARSPSIGLARPLLRSS
jgi:hypothetical protein